MVIVSANYITDLEALEFTSYVDKNEHLCTHSDENYWYKGINISNEANNFSFFKRININNFTPELLRIHKIDSNLITPEVPHYDTSPFSFIIFLNDNYTGGELYFKKMCIAPSKLTIVYFTKEESHWIKKVDFGVRYTLVGFLNSPIGFDRTTTLI